MLKVWIAQSIKPSPPPPLRFHVTQKRRSNSHPSRRKRFLPFLRNRPSSPVKFKVPSTMTQDQDSCPINDDDVCPINGDQIYPDNDIEVCPIDDNQVCPINDFEVCPIDDNQVCPIDDFEVCPIDDNQVCPIDDDQVCPTNFEVCPTNFEACPNDDYEVCPINDDQMSYDQLCTTVESNRCVQMTTEGGESTEQEEHCQNTHSLLSRQKAVNGVSSEEVVKPKEAISSIASNDTRPSTLPGVKITPPAQPLRSSTAPQLEGTQMEPTIPSIGSVSLYYGEDKIKGAAAKEECWEKRRMAVMKDTALSGGVETKHKPLRRTTSVNSDSDSNRSFTSCSLTFLHSPSSNPLNLSSQDHHKPPRSPSPLPEKLPLTSHEFNSFLSLPRNSHRRGSTPSLTMCEPSMTEPETSQDNENKQLSVLLSPQHVKLKKDSQDLRRKVLKANSYSDTQQSQASYKRYGVEDSCDPLCITILLYNSFQEDYRSTDSIDPTQTCRDTAEASYDSKDIAKELSDMVIYTEPIKFAGFKVSCFQYDSIIL